MTYRTAALCFGALFTVSAFTLLLIAVCTNWWVVIKVDEDFTVPSGTQELAYLSRNRGIFKECFVNEVAARPLLREYEMADSQYKCIYTDFSRDPGSVTGEKRMRADLMIAEASFLCLALLLCVCGFIVFCFGIYHRAEQEPRKWSLAVKWAGILLFATAFSNALGMAFFHAAEYVETQIVSTTSDDAVPYVFYFTLNQPTALRNSISRFYDWSYIISWLAVFLEILGAVILFLAGVCCRPMSEKEMYESSTMRSTKSFGHRNQAYDYAESKMPPAVYYSQPPAPMNEAMYYNHFNGRHFDPYRGASGPVAAQYNYEDGGWSWQ